MIRKIHKIFEKIKKYKSIFKSLYITAGVFVFLFVCFHILSVVYVSVLVNKSVTIFKDGITQELSNLRQQGDEVAEDPKLIGYLSDGNAENLLSLFQTERVNRQIGLMSVANSEGIILSRTISRSNLGENVFLTRPTGRLAALGKSAQSVELTGFGNQLFLTTVRPVRKDGKQIGALFANDLADDNFANSFKEKYLPKGTEVVFYTKDSGVFGASFKDPEQRKLLNSYFDPNSEWIKNGVSEKTVFFERGKYYLVENVIFPGLESSPGGALIFVPRQDLAPLTKTVIVLIVLLVFVYLSLRQHRKLKQEAKGGVYYLVLGLCTMPVAGMMLFALYLSSTGFLRLQRIPYTLYNSTLRFQPEFGIYDVAFEQRISIVVDTGDEPVNAVKTKLVFDPNAVEVKALESNPSVCSYVVENKVDQQDGKADFTCVFFKSGGERNSFKIADVVLKPKKRGLFTLSFDNSETQVLASDGLGTNVLRMSQSSSYSTEDFSPIISPAEASSTGLSFIVYSTTHPNPARWYNSATIRFVWRGLPGAVYRYAFDNSPDTVPSNKNTTQGTSLEMPVPGDGIYYFHLQSVKGGPVAHFRIRSDQTPPIINSVKVSEDQVFVGDVVRFSFDAEDKASGIQQNYYINFGNHLFLPIGSQLFVPFVDPGGYDVVLRVYDDAGNYSEKTKTVHVTKNPSQ